MPSGQLRPLAHLGEIPTSPDSRIRRRQPPGSRPLPAAGAATIAFEAFCLQYGDIYFRYARARLGSAGAASRAVRVALDGMSEQWHSLLHEASPTAACWSHFTTCVAARARSPLLAGLLGQPEADMFVLRHRLGLPVPEAASVMGMKVPEFSVRLGGAIRSLASA